MDENDPWVPIERTPPDGNVPEELGDESDTRKLRVGSKGGALLDSVDEPTELVERDSEDDVDWEKIVLVESDNAAIVGINPEDPEGGIDEGDECKSPEGCARPGGYDTPEALSVLVR